MTARAVTRVIVLWRDVTPVGVLAIAAAIASALAHEPPGRLDPIRAWASPSWASPFGRGEAGVDLLALVASASLSAMALAVGVALFGFVVGTPLGALAALARGRLERTVDRASDLLQAFPGFVLALAVLSAVRAPSRFHIGAVLALTCWAPFARLSLAQTRVLRNAVFVEAAYALGRGRWGLLVRHIIPNLLGVAAVQVGSTGASVVVSEAALAFVGLGPRDGVSLGAVIEQGVAAMLRAPHVLAVGSSAVFVTSAVMLVAGRAFARPLPP